MLKMLKSVDLVLKKFKILKIKYISFQIVSSFYFDNQEKFIKKNF